MRTFAPYTFRAKTFKVLTGKRISQSTPAISMFDQNAIDMGLPELFETYGISLTVQESEDEDEKTIVGMCQYEHDPDMLSESGDAKKEHLWVMVERDAETGILDPNYKTTLMRDSEDDEETKWSFQGEIRNQTGVVWELLFARIKPRRYGPERRN